MGSHNTIRLCTVIFLTLAAALAQDTGRLTGDVIDGTGGAVPAAKLDLRMSGSAVSLLSSTTTSAGLFALTGLRPGSYDLIVEAPGFQRLLVREIKVDAGRDTNLTRLQLQLGAISESIEITGLAPSVQTTNAEISTTVTNEQVRRLPLFDRSPLQLIHTQAGVTSGRGNTVINGLRTAYSNATLDGINIQDNAVRSNSLDFLPNLLLMDQVAEMSIITSNGPSSLGGGVSQLTFVTPSGSNQAHGALYWYNRNNVTAANDWFNNKQGIQRPFLNQNQGGGSLGGHIIKDRLFFYANYEALRLRQQDSATRTILTEDARRGIFTYRSPAGDVRKVNIITANRTSMDPAIQNLINQIPTPDRINSFLAGDSSQTLLRNTAGYAFLVRDNRTRDNATGKIDYVLSPKHTLSGTLAWNRVVVDRPDQSNDYSPVPKVRNDDARTLLSLSWRSSFTPRFTNEARGGFNLDPAKFLSSEKFPAYFVSGLAFSYPINDALDERRKTNNFAWQDNATYVVGNHRFQFGAQALHIRLMTQIDQGTIPSYDIAIGTGNVGLTPAQLPGIGAADFARANSLLATLAGYVEGYAQTFNVTSRTSGYVPGAPRTRHNSLNNLAGYFQDSWRLRKRLTLNLGVRYDYWASVDERDGLALIPIVTKNDPIATLLSNATLDFAGKSIGRRWYNPDRNNLAPNVSLAWDVFGNGRTALRAGYAISYVNDDSIIALENNVGFTNQGLSADVADGGLTGRLSTNLPRIPTPAFRTPITAASNYLNNPFTAMGLPDPNLRIPYVQQWTFSIQHELRGNVFELRYVGNHATKSFRAFDYNQVVIRENGFLDDFRRAQSNGNLAIAAVGTFDPRYNPAIRGSQQLTVFPKLEFGGLLTNPVVSNLIQIGSVGDLATVYQVNELNGAVNFFRNPLALGTNLMTNYSNSTYNALQFDVRRRMSIGLFFQANYSFSKVLSDAAGQSQFRFEPFLDLANGAIERSRAPFDLTHVIKGNWIYDVPFGPGHRISAKGPLNRILGGWSISGLVSYQSGTPFSVLSGRATFNRGARSGNNTAITPLNKAELDQLFQFRMTGDGPYFVASSAIGNDGRAVAADGRPSFGGQVFFHPGAGQIGSLQRRLLSGPWVFDMDARLVKSTRIRERQSVELYIDAFSVFNHPTWFVGDQALDSVNFGRIGSNFTAPRVLQLGLYYRF